MTAINKSLQALDAADRLLATMQSIDLLERCAADMVKQIIEKQDLAEKQQRECDAMIETLTDCEFLELCKLTADKITTRLEKVTKQ